MNQKTKKALNITSYVLIGLIFVLGIMAIWVALTTDEKNNDVPKLFGGSVLSVQSNSMHGTFNKGDLILIKRISSQEKAELKEGDIITFKYAKDAKTEFNTHMIVAKEIIDGRTMYTTRGTGWIEGTKDPIPQDASGNDKDKVDSSHIIGLYNGRLPGMGNIIDFCKSQLGMGLIIILPLFAFLVYRIYVVIKLMIGIKKEKDQGTTLSEMEAMQAEIERLKAEMKAEKGESGESPQ